MEALQIYEKQNNSEKLQTVYYMMSQLYRIIDETEKAIACCEKSIALNNEDEYIFYALASIYSSINQHEKGKGYCEEALRLATLHNNTYLTGGIYLILANEALNNFDFDTTEKYAQLSLEINKQFGRGDCCLNYIMLSKIEMAKGNIGKSDDYIREAFEIAVDFDGLQEKRLCYMILSELAAAQHKYYDNVRYWNEISLIENVIAKEKSVRAAEEMAAKYETGKKEMRIASLEEEKRLMRLLSFTGGSLLLMGLAALFFLWRWTVQKRRLAESHIMQLEQEKQLIATQSVLDGEVQERSRLARDLHDGMGGKLTAMKLYLEKFKQNAKFDDAEVQQFDKAMDILAESVQEMRRVSHNLMPDTLSRDGLKQAVDDFCRSMSSNIIFNYYGDEARINLKLEALIYRCISELVNNALKYASATQIMVQIIQEADRISFTVQDDGCGFDPYFTTKGIGLQNIRTRVVSFGGDIQIDSKPGEGTEVNIALRIS
jgi:signal transduction histidine kinase